MNRPTTWSAAPDGEDHDGPYLVPAIPGGIEGDVSGHFASKGLQSERERASECCLFYT